MKARLRNYLSILLISCFCTFFSILKFSHCFSTDFSGVAATSHGCYTDIPIFWNTHLLELHLWPYQTTELPEINQKINPVEYPFLTGLVMWALSYLTPLTGNTDGNFFIINLIFMSLVFTFSLIIMNKLKTNSHKFIAAAPAVVFSLYINWDIWAVFALLVALHFYRANKFTMSALFFATSISFKFFAVAILPLIFILGVKNQNLRNHVLYIFKVIVFFSFINAPAAIYNFSGWFYFYKISSERNHGSGSLWEILDLSGSNYTPGNFTYISFTVLFFILISLYILKSEVQKNLIELSFLFVFSFVLFNKIYSPQYVMWLTFLAALSINTFKQKMLYLFWQITELIYHFAIWRYLYWQGHGMNTEGIDANEYKWISITRYVALILFTASLIEVRRMKNSKKIFD